MDVSLTEENYLKAIFSINLLNGDEGVSTNELSEHLNNKAGSVTDMLKRLSEKKLVNYEKYKAVHLTAKGRKLALNIVRKHRLWEVFLTEKLKFGWDEVHEIAEQLEHIKSEELVRRLDTFLGHPEFDPHGDPIPNDKGELREVKARPLNRVKTSGTFIFTGVAEHSQVFLRHLTSIGLRIGDRIRVEELNTYDRSVKIKIGKQESRYISEKVSANILVELKK